MLGQYRYRYYISIDAGSSWIRLKLVNYPNVKFTRDNDKFYIRKKSEAFKIVRHENPYVYDTVLALLSDFSTINYEIQVKIDAYTGDDFQSFNYNEYTGRVPIGMIKVDEGVGSMLLESEVVDSYDWVDKYGDVKIKWKDIITDTATLNTVSYEATHFPRYIWQCYAVSYADNLIPGGYVECTAYPPTWVENRAYIENSTYNDIPYDHIGFGDDRAWVRLDDGMGGYNVYCCILSHTSVLSTKPDAPNGGSYWRLVPSGLYLWRSFVQRQSRMPGPGFSAGDGEMDAGFPFITLIDGAATNCPSGNYYKADCTGIPTTVEWNYGANFIELKDFISYFLTTTRNGITASGFTLASDFFSATENPYSEVNPNPFKYIQVAPTGFVMPGVGFNYGEIKKVIVESGGGGYAIGDLVRIIQDGNTSCQFEVIGVDSGAITSLNVVDSGSWYVNGSGLTTSASTGGGSNAVVSASIYMYDDTTSDYCFNDLMRDICAMFNCYYYINSSDEVVIEHAKFFLNEFSYTVTPSPDIDLTDSSDYPYKYQVVTDVLGNPTDKQYSWEGIKLPKFEKFEYSQANIAPCIIEYAFPMANPKETEEHSIQLISPDVEMMAREPNNHNQSGLVFICCDVDGNILKRDCVVEDIATEDVMNGDLYWNNLLADYHNYNRYFSSGYINKGNTYEVLYFEKVFVETRGATAFSVRRIKTQIPISFPKLVYFDPYKLITTNLGDGWVKEAELSTDTDFVKVTLLY